jgi:hypothetical protein
MWFELTLDKSSLLIYLLAPSLLMFLLLRVSLVFAFGYVMFLVADEMLRFALLVTFDESGQRLLISTLFEGGINSFGCFLIVLI